MSAKATHSTFLAIAATCVLCTVILGRAYQQAEPDSPDYGTKLSADRAASVCLAWLYPGDVGIDQDSSVVFFDDFETGGISDLGQRWTNVNNKDGEVMSFASENAPGSPGQRSLRMTGTKGRNTGGDLWKLLDRGYDQLYARFYCKFAEDAPYVHHFVSMSGKVNSPPYPVGMAGIRPTGYDRFGSTIDLLHTNANPPGHWSFYTYWCEMRSWQTPEGESDGRPNAFYGNEFGPEEPEQAKRGEWQCVEFMIKLNSAPDKRDGEQAFWIDGKPVSRWGPGSHTGTWFRSTFRTSGIYNTNPQPFEGFLWSKTDELKINIFRLQYYLASVFEQDWAPEDTTILYNSELARIQFDNFVVATRYIGPIATQTGFDFDQDGRLGSGDFFRMLKMRLADSRDLRTDYNGDGRSTVADMLQMLLDIIKS